MGQLCQAVLAFRHRAGRGFAILPFFSGIEGDAVGPMWDLREAGVPCMEENYWGGPEVYGKRWADVRLFHLDRQGAVLSQAPGFFLDEARRGPRTVEEFRADVALCRRIAPEMRGISLFNAYHNRAADQAANELIEDLFFGPVIHLHPRQGKLMVQNIGNEDTVAGGALAFLRGDEVLVTADIPVLVPDQEIGLEVPSGARRVRLELPEEMHHVYPGGVFELPPNLNPLQVLWCSIRQGETVDVGDHDLQIHVLFNKPVKYADLDSIWLRGTSTGMVAIQAVELSADRERLSITIQGLPADRYSLRLLSGKTHFRDDAGHPLDGSGNGFCENAPGLYRDADHFALDFRAARRAR